MERFNRLIYDWKNFPDPKCFICGLWFEEPNHRIHLCDNNKDTYHFVRINKLDNDLNSFKPCCSVLVIFKNTAAFCSYCWNQINDSIQNINASSSSSIIPTTSSNTSQNIDNIISIDDCISKSIINNLKSSSLLQNHMYNIENIRHQKIITKHNITNFPKCDLPEAYLSMCDTDFLITYSRKSNTDGKTGPYTGEYNNIFGKKCKRMNSHVTVVMSFLVDYKVHAGLGINGRAIPGFKFV